VNIAHAEPGSGRRDCPGGCLPAAGRPRQRRGDETEARPRRYGAFCRGAGPEGPIPPRAACSAGRDPASQLMREATRPRRPAPSGSWKRRWPVGPSPAAVVRSAMGGGLGVAWMRRWTPCNGPAIWPFGGIISGAAQTGERECRPVGAMPAWPWRYRAEMTPVIFSTRRFA
jgi:hypothetical protein